MDLKPILRTLTTILFISLFAIRANAQFNDGGSFRDGYYYDFLGKKHTGLIKFKATKTKLFGLNSKVMSSFFFKTDSKAEKQVIQVSEAKSVVALADSFIVHTLYSVNKKGDKVADTTNLFVQVYLDNVGKRVYRSQYGLTGFHNGAATSFTDYVIYDQYYYGDSMDNAVLITKDNFTEILGNVVKDSSALSTKVESGKYKYEDIGSLLYDYRKEKGIAGNISDGNYESGGVR